MTNPALAMSSIMLAMTPLILTLINFNSPLFHLKTKSAIKMAFFISSIPLIGLMNDGLYSFSLSYSWFNISTFSSYLSIQLDIYSITFIPLALFVSWSISEYSTWYMHDDPKIQLFSKYLLIFLLAMIILVTAGNLITLFIGWEGVGVMSYLLIGWYFTRSNAGTAALQAILYNRIGDIGFLFSMFWLISSYNSTDFNFIFSLQPNTVFIIMMIIAAASKSAQFLLHPWLASAMEGPTPVSALLHSSTMVVAGVFLLIRIHPMISKNQTSLTVCLCLGAISTAFAATCALSQNDLKKIIAYSTSSQLGLMVVAIGLNLPHLAFFHICTHAFFKAMLFLCSGSIIHNLNNEQDIRKMGGLQKMLPVTTLSTSIGSLALMGTPYLAGFYSKDAIIEAINYSNLNLWALTLTTLATSFTATYSLRLIYFTSMLQPRLNSLLTLNENNPSAINPIKRLAIGTVVSGLIMNHIILPTSPLTLTLPPHLKIMALVVTILGFMLALDLTKMWWTSPHTPTQKINPFLFSSFIHLYAPHMMLSNSLKISQLIDAMWVEKIGPKNMTNLQLPPIFKNQETQSGTIKIYLSAFVVSSFICLVSLYLM